jgi:hypothetical protein
VFCLPYAVIAKQFPTTSAKSTLENDTERARWEALYVHVYAMVRRWKQLPTIAQVSFFYFSLVWAIRMTPCLLKQVAERTREEKRSMGQTDKPPSNLPEDSTVDEGAATLDRIERGLKETSRLVGDHLVWETIGDRASERAVEFLLDKRDVNESVEVKRAERARREDKERGDAERARLASIAGSNSSEVAPTGEHPRITSEGDPIEDGPSNLEKQSDKKRERNDLEEASPSHPTQHKEPSDGDSPDKTASHKGSHDELTTNDIIAVKRLKRGEESDSSNDEPVVAAAVRLF